MQLTEPISSSPEWIEEAANSPFLPSTYIQFAWDSSSLGWLKECPRKYFYSMILGIQPRGKGVHLSFGLWYQSALEVYAKRKAVGDSHDGALCAAVLRALRDSDAWRLAPPEGETKKTRANLIRTIIWKLDHFEHDVLETIVLSNGTPAVELSFRFELDWEVAPDRPYMLCGHFDALVRFHGEPFVLDNKTTGSTLSPHYFRQYSPNNQMSLYNLAGKVVYSIPTRGVIIDAAQIAVGFSEFSRGFAHRTEGQDQEWLDSTAQWLSSARDYAILQKTYEVCKAPAPERAWPMNDKSCDKFGGCPFQSLCDKDPSTRGNFISANFEKRRWNPLDTRE